MPPPLVKLDRQKLFIAIFQALGIDTQEQGDIGKAVNDNFSGISNNQQQHNTSSDKREAADGTILHYKAKQQKVEASAEVSTGASAAKACW